MHIAAQAHGGMDIVPRSPANFATPAWSTQASGDRDAWRGELAWTKFSKVYGPKGVVTRAQRAEAGINA